MKTDLSTISKEAQEVVEGMVHHCLNRSYCMGMDEGFKSYEGYEDKHKHAFRLEIEKFFNYKS
tara:strand:+ start:274 stop:462 length:189 start_codon:yes stop_codon:yes gene_type:complete